jgi:hypothetical protein
MRPPAHGVSPLKMPGRNSPQNHPAIVSPAATGREDRQRREEQPWLMDPVWSQRSSAGSSVTPTPGRESHRDTSGR